MGQEQCKSAPPDDPPSRRKSRPVGPPAKQMTEPSPPPVVQQEQPGLLARMRSAVGNRTLEDVCTIDKNAKVLGKGTFGTVYRARLKNGHKAAVKIIEKAKLKQLRVSSRIVGTECEMMRECAGKDNCMQLLDIVETETRFCLILELCDGGNVQDGAMASEGQLGESQVRNLMKQMLDAIYFLHSKNICHRDIKPHNYLLVGDIRSAAVKVKLGDFGTALRLERGKLLKDQVGTPAFMAPEIHLLPNKSSGYDHKVDVWAVGVCMIFLLANEYPFIDGQGKLLRHRIIQGDVPLWEANAFQNLFQGAQEMLGMIRKRPSNVARDLTRHLLAPRRQDRLSAWAALKHDWFEREISETTTLDDVSDNLPLLDMKDFEDAFSRMEQNVGWTIDALSKVQIGTVEEVHFHIDPADDRLTSCVVCYNGAGEFGYTCAQCYHRVCWECLQQLPQAICPYCRHDATDMAITQTIAQLARKGSDHSNKVYDQVTSLGNMSVFMDMDAPSHMVSSEDNHRRHKCHCCNKPASSANYICPSCTASMCFDCTKNVLVAHPQCPCCGEIERVAATVPQYIAANEVWASAALLGDAIGRSLSDVSRRFSSFSTTTGSSPTPHACAGSMADFSMGGPDNGPDCSIPAERQRQRSISAPIYGNGGSGGTHGCCVCRGDTSMFDHTCPCCNSIVCTSCICTRLPKEDLRCPCCNDASSNMHSMHLIATAHQARNSWTNFWGSVVDAFQDDPRHRNVHCSPDVGITPPAYADPIPVSIRKGSWP